MITDYQIGDGQTISSPASQQCILIICTTYKLFSDKHIFVQPYQLVDVDTWGAGVFIVRRWIKL